MANRHAAATVGIALAAILVTPVVHEEDIESLRTNPDWTERRSEGTRQLQLGIVTRSFGKRTEFHRKRDGCRVRAMDGKVEVEVSLPRVLGYRNDQQDLLSEEDDRHAVDAVTSDLLPRTTGIAQESPLGVPWHLTRLDLASNFAGWAKPFVEAYRHARRPRSSTIPIVYESRKEHRESSDHSLVFYGKDYEFILYGTGERQPRGSARAATEGKMFRSDSNGRVRLELRFRTTRGLERLLEHFAPDERGLPFLVTSPDRTPRVIRYGLDHHRLHQVVATEIRAFGVKDTIASAAGAGMTVSYRLFLLHLAEHPEYWAEVAQECEPRTVRKYRRELTTLLINEQDLDIVKRAWNRPRPHPVLVRTLLERYPGRTSLLS